MGALILLGMIILFICGGFFLALCVAKAYRPYPSVNQIQEVLRKHHDDYGEFDYCKAAKEIVALAKEAL